MPIMMLQCGGSNHTRSSLIHRKVSRKHIPRNIRKTDTVKR